MASANEWGHSSCFSNSGTLWVFEILSSTPRARAQTSYGNSEKIKSIFQPVVANCIGAAVLILIADLDRKPRDKLKSKNISPWRYTKQYTNLIRSCLEWKNATAFYEQFDLEKSNNLSFNFKFNSLNKYWWIVKTKINCSICLPFSNYVRKTCFTRQSVVLPHRVKTCPTF